ncbi:MAG: ABC transporter ATP-binding protein [Dehalococcoidia bacterium]|jgi:ABC-type sugar transport system ATPase subunit
MIKLENLTVKLSDFTLRDINLEINGGEYFIIVGPTGAGKTILLESIAGLYRLTDGSILFGGQDITRLEPEKRHISIVYQDYSLFPHLRVRDNILFGLRLAKKTRGETDEALGWIADLLGITDLLPRRPETLSGGERQKVALARALVIKPEVLLLDEPLSALDPETRETVRQELVKTHRTLGITTVHVTHDFEEAMSLGKRVAVLGEGELKQVGTAEQVFRHPESEFVARFVMMQNIISGEVNMVNNTTFFRGEGLEFRGTATGITGSCYATIRPEDFLVSLGHVSSGTYNCLTGKITDIVDRGATLSLRVDIPPVLTCLIMRHSFSQMSLQTGQKVYLSFPPSSVHLFSG